VNRLVITADDFGLAREVNEAVDSAHRRGVLSAASLMVGAPAAADAVHRARALPNLGVGLHLVLVDGISTLPPDEIPALTDQRTGRFRSDLGRLAIEISYRSSLRGQIRREIEAQFRKFQATGLPLDHVTVHKHYHLHPIIGAMIIEIGQKFGMKYLRVPKEPSGLIATLENGRADIDFLKLWVALLRIQASRAGIIGPDKVFGLKWSGALTPERLIRLLENLPSGFIEIYAHPAVTNAFCGSTRGYRYTDELVALLSPAVQEALQRSQFRLGPYTNDAGANPSRPLRPEPIH